MAEMSPLRRRIIEDMTVRSLSPATQRSYLHAVTKFSRHFGRAPDRACRRADQQPRRHVVHHQPALRGRQPNLQC